MKGKQHIDALTKQVQALYQEDSSPWVIGYSGGKDSTAVLQLIWMALAQLAPEERVKPVHVICTDTLVENPIVAQWATGSLEAMRQAAAAQGLPIYPHQLKPALEDRFWVKLIGKGYASPRPKFRWCTERLKIKPANHFIKNAISEHGEVILVLGTRKAESITRAARMERLEAQRVREGLSPNASLPGSLVYTPIEDWSDDDVWLFLMRFGNPWGWSNKGLLTLYQGATADGECPLVLDTSTPSCSNSRFGCWVCTLVDKDRSMEAMINNDHTKEWMLPLLELRDALDQRDDQGRREDRDLREWRRMDGRVQAYSRGLIPGPYTQEARAQWLRRLLRTQARVRQLGPEQVRQVELISLEELEEIRRIWRQEKREIEDLLPVLYEEETGQPYPALRRGPDPFALCMEEVEARCSDDRRHYERVRAALAIVQEHCQVDDPEALARAIEKELRKHRFNHQSEALRWAQCQAMARAQRAGRTRARAQRRAGSPQPLLPGMEAV